MVKEELFEITHILKTNYQNYNKGILIHDLKSHVDEELKDLPCHSVFQKKIFADKNLKKKKNSKEKTHGKQAKTWYEKTKVNEVKVRQHYIKLTLLYAPEQA